MAKVHSATINFKLRTTKVLKDGTSPIVLCVQYNGRKDKYTGFTCTKDCWDDRNQQVKKKLPNFVMINKMLQTLKNEVIQKKLYYEQNNIDYTASMLLENKVVKDNNSKLVSDIIDRLVEERRLGLKRKLSFNTAFNSYKNFSNKTNLKITDINDISLIDYMKYLDNKIEVNTIFNYITTIYTVIQYAYDADIIKTFPKKSKAYFKRKYHRETHHKALNDDIIFKLRWFFDRMEGDVTNRYSKKFALGVYLMSYSMFGLAPIDLLKLHQKQVTIVEKNNSLYYVINTHRSKTNVPVRIFVNKDINENIIQPFITNNRTHLLPIFVDDMNEEQMLKSSRNFNEVVNRNLGLIAEELNIPKFTLYSARHSFASIAVKDNMSLGLISSGMGRSIQGITTYIKNLNTDDDLLKLTQI